MPFVSRGWNFHPKLNDLDTYLLGNIEPDQSGPEHRAEVRFPTPCTEHPNHSPPGGEPRRLYFSHENLDVPQEASGKNDLQVISPSLIFLKKGVSLTSLNAQS